MAMQQETFAEEITCLQYPQVKNVPESVKELKIRAKISIGKNIT